MCWRYSFLAVKDGKNAQDLSGRLCNTQAGENLNIYRNTFIGPMTKEAIRVQSYNKVMHKKIVIAHNNFEHCSQKIYLNHVQDVILVGNGDAKVVKNKLNK